MQCYVLYSAEAYVMFYTLLRLMGKSFYFKTEFSHVLIHLVKINFIMK